MATEPFLINPYRSNFSRRHNAPKKRKKAIALTVAPTKRASRSHRGRARLHLGPMHRPVLYGSGKSWVRSIWSKSKGSGIKLNPRRRATHRRRHFRHNPGGSLLIAGANPRRSRRYHRNPALAIGGFDFVKNAPLILTGALSAASLVIVPNFLKLSSTSPLVKYGVQAGVVVGGGYLAGKALGSQYAYSWMLAGSAVVLADVLQHYVFGTLLPASVNLTAGLGAFPGYKALSAFPEQQLMPSQRYDTLDVYPSAGDDGPY